MFGIRAYSCGSGERAKKTNSTQVLAVANGVCRVQMSVVAAAKDGGGSDLSGVVAVGVCAVRVLLGQFSVKLSSIWGKAQEALVMVISNAVEAETTDTSGVLKDKGKRGMPGTRTSKSKKPPQKKRRGGCKPQRGGACPA